MDQLAIVLSEDRFVFNTRDLYKIIGYSAPYSQWMTHIIKSLDLIEGQDYITQKIIGGGRGRPFVDYHVDALTMQRLFSEYQWQRK